MKLRVSSIDNFILLQVIECKKNGYGVYFLVLIFNLSIKVNNYLPSLA